MARKIEIRRNEGKYIRKRVETRRQLSILVFVCESKHEAIKGNKKEKGQHQNENQKKKDFFNLFFSYFFFVYFIFISISLFFFFASHSFTLGGRRWKRICNMVKNVTSKSNNSRENRFLFIVLI